MIKDIIVVLDEVGGRAGPYAISLAAKLGAFVTGLSMSPEEACETLALAETRYDVIVSCREALLGQAESVKDRFVSSARDHVLGVEAEAICAEAAATEDGVLARARLHDLAIVEQRDPGQPKPCDRYIDPLLLRSGRPVLVIPYIQTELATFDRILVGWDGSAPAARALSDAMPFLQRANHVEILSIATVDLPDDEDRDEKLVRHLARHGVDAEARTSFSNVSVAAALMSHAADSGADLLVMGAYGHSRLREALLGGTSRGVLQSMTLPVLMSH